MVTPAAAFVKTILDDAPNIAPGRKAAHVGALTKAIYRFLDQRLPQPIRQTPRNARQNDLSRAPNPRPLELLAHLQKPVYTPPQNNKLAAG